MNSPAAESRIFRGSGEADCEQFSKACGALGLSFGYVRRRTKGRSPEPKPLLELVIPGLKIETWGTHNSVPPRVLDDLHFIGVPIDDLAALDAEIAEERGAGGAIAEDRVFNDRLPRTDRSEEVAEVVVAVAVALGREVLFRSAERSVSGVGRIFLFVLFFDLLLHGFRKCVDGEAGIVLPGDAGDGQPVPADLHGAFGAGEDK